LWVPSLFVPTQLPMGINLPPMQVTAAYRQQDESTNVLVVGRLQSQVPRSPTRALHEVLGAFSGQQVIHELHRAPLRTRTMHGVSFLGVRQRDQSTNHLVLTMLTEDGQSYWLVGIIGESRPDGSNWQRLGALASLVGAMCQHATAPRYTAAIAEDFTDAGLGVLTDDALGRLGLGAFVEAGRTEASPIHLKPTSLGVTDFQWLRVMGAADSGESDPANPLSPRRLLLEQFRLTQKREPTEGEFWWGMAAGVDAWRISFPLPPTKDGSTNLGLIWDLWYVRLGDGRGALIETRYEPNAAGAMQNLVPRLVDALRQSPPTGVSADGFAQAIGRGEQVATQLRAQLGQRHRPQSIYGVLRVNGRIVRGYAEVCTVRVGTPLSLAGRALMLQPEDGTQVQLTWAMSRDGARREDLTRVLEPAGAELRLVEQERLVLGEDRLTLLRREGDAESEVWSWPASAALVTATEYWPCETMSKLGPGPTLVWLSRHDQPPAPHWATLTPTTGHDRSTSGWRLALRPLMAIDGEVMVFSAGGDLRSAILRTPLPVVSGSLPVYAQIVDRQTLLTEVPAMVTTLPAWEKQSTGLLH
jgi:hypothetical protein